MPVPKRDHNYPVPNLEGCQEHFSLMQAFEHACWALLLPKQDLILHMTAVWQVLLDSSIRLLGGRSAGATTDLTGPQLLGAYVITICSSMKQDL